MNLNKKRWNTRCVLLG